MLKFPKLRGFLMTHTTLEVDTSDIPTKIRSLG